MTASEKNVNHLLYSDRNAHYQFHIIKDDYIMLKFYHEVVLYTMISTGNMDSYMEEQPQESACGSCLEASQRAKKALDDLETFGELQRLCLPLPSDIKDKVCRETIHNITFKSISFLPSPSLVLLWLQCLERSSAYIRQTKLLLRDHLFDQENLCKSTGQCTDESMSPRKDAITPLLTESSKVIKKEYDAGFMYINPEAETVLCEFVEGRRMRRMQRSCQANICWIADTENDSMGL